MKTRIHAVKPVVQRRAGAREGVRLQPPSYGIHHADTGGAGLPAPVQRKMEHALGADFSSVRVHEGPLAPSIGAQAFTRGTHVHFAPGQYQPHTRAGQQVLGHELAHVVQQSQGRARASTQVGGVGVDASPQLEREAETAGQRAAAGRSSDRPNTAGITSAKPIPAANSSVVQRRVAANTFKDFLVDQADLQRRARANPGRFKYEYTTVGFEHEFGQMTDGPLHGVDHFGIGVSNAPVLPFTNIPFVLETDAANAVELVSPPFLLETKSTGFGHRKSSRKPVPLADDVETVDGLIRHALGDAVRQHRQRVKGAARKYGGFEYNDIYTTKTMAEVTAALELGTGIRFPLDEDVAVEPYQLSPAGTTRFGAAPALDGVPVSPSLITHQTIAGIHVKPSDKGGGITSQVNFATDAATVDTLQREADADDSLRPGADGDGIVTAFRTAEATIRDALIGGAAVSAGLGSFYNALARALSGQIAVPYMAYFNARQADADAQHVRMSELGVSADALALAEGISSHVKDTSSVWVKDMVLNLGLGLLERAEWTQVLTRVTHGGTVHAIEAAVDVNVSNKWPALQRAGTRGAIVAATTAALAEVARAIRQDIRPQTWWGFSDRKRDLHFGRPNGEARLEFAQHRARDIGPRQDTYIRSQDVQTPLWDRRLHVVETRADIGDALKLLKKVGG